MRIEFPEMNRPKAAAKLLSRLSPSLQLSSVQEQLARQLGYRDWHEFSQVTAQVGRDNADLVPSAVVAGIVHGLADALGQEFGAVQYIAAKSRLLPGANLETQQAICTAHWRENIFGRPARGKPGTVVRVKEQGRPVRLAYLVQHQTPSYVVYDNGPGMVADFEVVTPRVPLIDFVPSFLWLPYGHWTLKDGSEVLFSRDYCPLWHIAGDTVRRLDPWSWIDGIHRNFWFSSYGKKGVWSTGPARDHALRYLADHRIFALPRLVDAMPILVRDGSQRTTNAVKKLFLERRERLPGELAVPPNHL